MAKRIREKAAKRIENKDNRPYATARYVRMGSSKAKRVLDTIRGKEYNVAKAILVNTIKNASVFPKHFLLSTRFFMEV